MYGLWKHVCSTALTGGCSMECDQWAADGQTLQIPLLVVSVKLLLAVVQNTSSNGSEQNTQNRIMVQDLHKWQDSIVSESGGIEPVRLFLSRCNCFILTKTNSEGMVPVKLQSSVFGSGTTKTRLVRIEEDNPLLRHSFGKTYRYEDASIHWERQSQ
jgi:hypothetical protein